MTRTHVRIFYPADPVGVVPGGIDTFLRGLIKYAPPDLEFSLVGMTTDVIARPLSRWTRCRVGEREFDFFPVVAVDDAGTRQRVPLSVRFVFGTWRHRAMLSRGFDVFDFHRIEPALLFRGDRRPKNAYFHQDPQIVRLEQSDNLWRHWPGLYEGIEARALQGFSSLWCVRDSGVDTLRSRYPALASQTRFIATWVDAEVFHPPEPARRDSLRRSQAEAWGIDPAAAWIVTVGRLDTQKNPMLMLEAFVRLCAQGLQVAWLVIGDGVLRGELKRAAMAAGVGERVHFLGLRSPTAIAEVLGAADLFALSSAYEGMPMALLEAMGCGLPAVVTDVGEVRRVVRPNENGVIAEGHDASAFAAALAEGLRGAPGWRSAALDAVQPYQPAKVLASTYANYRALAQLPGAISLARKAVRRVAAAKPLLADSPASAQRKTAMTTLLDTRAIEDLVARVDAALPSAGGRIVEFVASGAGEGTSTLAAAYADAQATRLNRRVLLLTSTDTSVAPPAQAPGLLQALEAGQPLDDMLASDAHGAVVGSLGGLGEGMPSWALLGRADLWQQLRERYDLVVLDMPATSVSGAALRVAPCVDGVVVVVEAEATRAPVVENLVSSLRALRANVLGAVFNKRQYHVPARLYRWL